MIIQVPPCTHEFLKDYANQLVFNKQQCLCAICIGSRHFCVPAAFSMLAIVEDDVMMAKCRKGYIPQQQNLSGIVSLLNGNVK